jgi:Leucine-rich repeat (LRR) protein
MQKSPGTWEKLLKEGYNGYFKAEWNTIPPESRSAECAARINVLLDKIGTDKVTYLNLGGLGLHEVPMDIIRCKKLTKLRLSDNDLSDVPAFILQLKDLTQIGLSRNNFQEFPVVLCQKRDLRKVIMTGDKPGLENHGNRLTSLPPEIGNWTQLVDFDLRGNDLVEIPPEAARMQALKKFNLRDNHHLRSIPNEVYSLPGLQKLEMRGTDIHSLPEGVSSKPIYMIDPL